VDGHDSLVAVGGGLPEWTDGIIDTGCIATRGSAIGRPASAAEDRRADVGLMAAAETAGAKVPACRTGRLR
jgi:hypothetical protein